MELQWLPLAVLVTVAIGCFLLATWLVERQQPSSQALTKQTDRESDQAARGGAQFWAVLLVLVVGPAVYGFAYLLNRAEGWTVFILPAILTVAVATMFFGKLSELGLKRIPLKHRILPMTLSLLAVSLIAASAYWAQLLAAART